MPRIAFKDALEAMNSGSGHQDKAIGLRHVPAQCGLELHLRMIDDDLFAKGVIAAVKVAHSMTAADAHTPLPKDSTQVIAGFVACTVEPERGGFEGQIVLSTSDIAFEICLLIACVPIHFMRYNDKTVLAVEFNPPFCFGYTITS